MLYVLLVLLVSRIVYLPMKYPAGNWEAAGQIGAVDVQIRDGLHGWYIEKPGAQLTTLHLHGNAGNVTHRVLSARHILDAGSSVLLLDYRGYGRSRGWPTESGLYEDALLAYEWLKQQGHREIIAHGESLGTAAATELALQRRCAGVVLEAPFTSLQALAGQSVPLLGPMLLWGFDAKSRISRIGTPLLIVHGDRDEVIAYRFGQELYKAASEPKRMWTIPGAMHNDLHVAGAEEFPARLRTFYDSLQGTSNPASAK